MPGTLQALHSISSLLPFTSPHSFNKLFYFKNWKGLFCIPTKLSDSTLREWNLSVKRMLHVQLAIWGGDRSLLMRHYCWGKHENFAIKSLLEPVWVTQEKWLVIQVFLWFTIPPPWLFIGAPSYPNRKSMLSSGKGATLWYFCQKEKKRIYIYKHFDHAPYLSPWVQMILLLLTIKTTTKGWRSEVKKDSKNLKVIPKDEFQHWSDTMEATWIFRYSLWWRPFWRELYLNLYVQGRLS